MSARSSERSGSLERNANEYAESIGVLWPGCVDDPKSKECEVPRELPRKSVRRARDLYPVYERTGAAKNWGIRRKNRRAKLQIVVPLQAFEYNLRLHALHDQRVFTVCALDQIGQ